jgi:Protein of unknown function (DUF1624).
MEARKQRFHDIDFLKTIFVCGMIIVHVYQLCCVETNKLMDLFSLYINVITFSGFFFVFGYLFNNIYFKKEKGESFAKFEKKLHKIIVLFLHISFFMGTLI